MQQAGRFEQLAGEDAEKLNISHQDQRQQRTLEPTLTTADVVGIERQGQYAFK